MTAIPTNAQAGAYVRSCRQSAGLSIDEAGARIAEYSGFSKLHGLTLDLVEQGRHLPSEAFLGRLAEAFPLDIGLFRALTVAPGSTRLH